MGDVDAFSIRSSASRLQIGEAANLSPCGDRSTRSWLPPSHRAGDLVRQAIRLLETDREAARRCLSQASALLGPPQSDQQTARQNLEIVKPGCLATWQKKQTLIYIEAHLASTIRIQDLAGVANLSKSHFCRAFRCSVGLPPMGFVLMRRLERAKAIISETREPLAAVALLCGFSDQSHLNRRFREIVGITPARWRRGNTLIAKPGPRIDRRRKLPLAAMG
jgi:AraC family transcriptional regulator